MSFLGIVGGAMQGAGEAGQKALHTEQEYVDKSDLQSQYMDALQQKDMALAQQSQIYAQQNAALKFGYDTQTNAQNNDAAMARTQVQENGANTRNKDNNTTSIQVAGMHESGANARTAAEIAARQSSELYAHTSYKELADGTIAALRPNKDGSISSTVVTGADGKPLQGIKSVPEVVLKNFESQMLIARSLVGTDPDQAKTIAANAQAMLAPYMPGGGGRAGGGAPQFNVPTGDKAFEADFKTLMGNPTPSMKKSFDDTYKQPGLAQYLINQSKGQGGGAAPAAAPASAPAAAPAAPAPAAPAPAAPTATAAAPSGGGIVSSARAASAEPASFQDRITAAAQADAGAAGQPGHNNVLALARQAQSEIDMYKSQIATMASSLQNSPGGQNKALQARMSEIWTNEIQPRQQFVENAGQIRGY